MLGRRVFVSSAVRWATSGQYSSGGGGGRAVPTAAGLVIGDEVLNGSTKDTNTNVLARFLTDRGVALRRVEVVPDEVDDISGTLQRLLQSVDYVFTSGGIGPTHDDMTYEAVAKAFGCELRVDPETKRLLGDALRQRGSEMTPARERMATLPTESEYLRLEGLWVPLVCVKQRCFVLPGIPSLYQRMLETASPHLPAGKPRLRRELYTQHHEGDIAATLREAALRGVSIGSYPMDKYHDQYVDDPSNSYSVKIVLHSHDEAALQGAVEHIQEAFHCSPELPIPPAP